VRDGVDGPEVALVHRPRYDDWSLPKGKLDSGESWKDAALREVLEETGLECTLVEELESTTYLDRKGRTKMVRYWLMAVVGGTFEPNDEVDEMRWVPATEAIDVVGSEHDRRLLEALVAAGRDGPSSNKRPDSGPDRGGARACADESPDT